MIESKSGVFLIAGLGCFAVAFASNALLPIMMYRHLPEKTARQTVDNNHRVMMHFQDLYSRYPGQFEQHLAGELPESVRRGLTGTDVDKKSLFLFDQNSEAAKDLCATTLKIGRKAYVGEACWHCHSQFVRPVSNESLRWGPVSKSWEFQSELQRPVLFGTRRVGPDLAREASRRGNDWHAVHLLRPKDTSPESVMPAYPWFFDKDESNRPNSALPNRRGLGIILYMQWLGSELESLDRTGDKIRTTLEFGGDTSMTRTLRRLRTLAIIAVFLVPAGYGFSTKFHELVLLTGDEEGAFAVMPVVTYLTATLGFFFMLVYATMNGMFRNIEQPKLVMLETERRLDDEMLEVECGNGETCR